jgi:thioredoxin reductase (NADPH)
MMSRGPTEVVAMGQDGDDRSAERAAAASADPALSRRLTAGQLESLRPYGEVRGTVAGQVLFREGDRSYDFIVILTGSVKVLDHEAGEQRELADAGPGDFLAELGILTGERLFTTAVVAEPGSVLLIPVERLRAVIAHDQALADLIVQNAFRRRRLLAQARAGMQIVGSRASADTRRIRQFATRNRFPHVFLDVETEPAAGTVLGHHGLSAADVPIVVMRGGEVLRNPSNAELARAAGFGSGPTPGTVYDVAVVGAGPAGLAASVYTASEGLATAVIDGSGVGGQIGTTSRIENYLGFPVGVSGDEFAERALVQVLHFGATLLAPASAVGLLRQGHGYAVELDGGDVVLARCMIVGTGVRYRQLDATGLERFDGLGVFYTPIAAQDEFGPGDEAVIVGGGNSAGQAATFLADRGHRVTVVVRGGDLRASMSEYLVERIDEQPVIEVLYHCAVEAVEGRGRLERVVVRDAMGGRRTLQAAALFVLIGAEPHTQWVRGAVELDRDGFILTGAELGSGAERRPPWDGVERSPYLLETSLPGVFAAGDVRSGSVKRVASAVGEGSIAAHFAGGHLGSRSTSVPGSPDGAGWRPGRDRS